MASFILDYFYDALAFLGLWHKDAKIIFLGLDNAGKTTLLGMLKHDKMSTNEPTLHPNSDELIVGSVKFTAHDLGGHEAARALWEKYFYKVDGIIFMVDTQDHDRFPEAKKELDKVLTHQGLAKVPVVILGNKIDLKGAASEETLRFRLGLSGGTTGKSVTVTDPNVRPMELFMCSVLRKMGYRDAFEWLSKHIK
eukprot:g507.t1